MSKAENDLAEFKRFDYGKALDSIRKLEFDNLELRDSSKKLTIELRDKINWLEIEKRDFENKLKDEKDRSES